MTRDSQVEGWLSEKNDPPQALMRRVRAVIVGADTRITEYIKYGTLTFGYEGDMVTFVQANAKTVTLMFNRGARIQGNFPHLEGSGPSARFMRFKDLAEVDKRATELSKIVEAWCNM
ncbi:MAG TPA: DUF1801 domain-containing protein, partial [Candidatus Dormibacteraeota bacterium]